MDLMYKYNIHEIVTDYKTIVKSLCVVFYILALPVELPGTMYNHGGGQWPLEDDLPPLPGLLGRRVSRAESQQWFWMHARHGAWTLRATDLHHKTQKRRQWDLYTK